jgi:dipeptidyl aminopeptidase/acylaminoacyl peptidase
MSIRVISRVCEKNSSTQHARIWLASIGLMICASVILSPATAQAGTFAGVNGNLLLTNITGAAYHFSSLKSDGTGFKDVLVDSVSKYDVEYSPDGTKFAYVQSVSSTPQVFIANADGSNPHQVSTSSGIKYTPSWSPDGTKLLYSQAVSSQVHIFRSNIDGTNETEITSSGVYYNPVYSPDGTKIIATFDSTDDEIYSMDPDGSNVINLTNNSVEDRKASWSPDGTKIVYSSGVSGFFEIFTMSPNGSNKSQLTSTAVGNQVAVYSPDGTKIAYRDNLAPSLIHIMNADGTGDTTYPYVWIRELTWQPLTRTPQSTTPNPTIALSGGKASINIASLYTDTYEGIDASSVSVTSQPKLGAVSIDSATGTVTYTPRATAQSSTLRSLANIFVPSAHAAPTDNFTYRVCSLSSGSLCATGTVTINLIAAPLTGLGSTPSSPLIGWLMGGLSILAILAGSALLQLRHIVRPKF